MINTEEILLLNGTFTALKDDQGKWIYKANPAPFKKNGALKKEYHDMPRYKLIVELEDTFKKSLHSDVVKKSILEIITQLKDGF